MPLNILAPRLQALKSHDQVGTSLVLVVGFTNLSYDFMFLCNFHGPTYYSVSFGHVASLVLAKLNLCPLLRDAVFPNSARFLADYLNTFFNDLHHGRYPGR